MSPSLSGLDTPSTRWMHSGETFRSAHGGHLDTVNALLYRKPGGKVEAKKRQRPARLPVDTLRI